MIQTEIPRAGNRFLDFYNEEDFSLTARHPSDTFSRVDAITRDIILKLTTRVADLEAAVEVSRVMLKDLAQEQATVTGKSFDATIFDLQRAEAINQQREKMAIGAEEKETVAAAPFILDLPEVDAV